MSNIYRWIQENSKWEPKIDPYHYAKRKVACETERTRIRARKKEQRKEKKKSNTKERRKQKKVKAVKNSHSTGDSPGGERLADAEKCMFRRLHTRIGKLCFAGDIDDRGDWRVTGLSKRFFRRHWSRNPRNDGHGLIPVAIYSELRTNGENESVLERKKGKKMMQQNRNWNFACSRTFLLKGGYYMRARLCHNVWVVTFGLVFL